MPRNDAKPHDFSKTAVPHLEADEAAPRRPGRLAAGRPKAQLPTPRRAQPVAARRAAGASLRVVGGHTGQALDGLVREWLLELKVMGRSAETIRWYRQKITGFLDESGAATLDQLVPVELKQHLANLQERGLSDNTIHGYFEVVKAFANWCDREGYKVEPALLKMRGPKVAQKEREVYSQRQLAAIFGATPPGWSTAAVQILLGTGMRVAELCALEVEDFEDDGDAAFLKIRKGKGAKFRRAPVSQRLRRELHRYLNRARPESSARRFLLLTDGRPVGLSAVAGLFRRLRAKLGFSLHAHKFRHTFATAYIENGGEVERLRRILGHSSYAMIARYVHLNKTDLAHDFDNRTPF